MHGKRSVSEYELFPNEEENKKMIVYWNENIRGHFLFNRYNIENSTSYDSGIYFIYWDYGKLLYIGETLNIHCRLLQHFKGTTNTNDIKHNFHLFQYIPVPENKLKEYEFFYINYIRPRLNVGSVLTYDTQRYNEKYSEENYLKTLQAYNVTKAAI